MLAFDRGGAVTVVTRLPVGLAEQGGWADTTLELPAGEWVNVLGGSGSRRQRVRLADLMADLPVALLVGED